MKVFLLSLALIWSASSFASDDGAFLRPKPEKLVNLDSPLFIGKTSVFAYHWTQMECSSEGMVDYSLSKNQERAWETTLYIRQKIEPKVQDLVSRLDYIVPGWRKNKKIFPIDLNIGINGKYGWACESSTALKPPYVIEIPAYYGTAITALNSLLSHEFAHIFLRVVLGSRDHDSILSEAIPDYIAMYSDGFSPFHNREEDGVYLSTVNERSSYEFPPEIQLRFNTSKRCTSEKGSRDFSMPHTYQFAYITQEHHVASCSFNSLFFRLGSVLGSEELTDTTLNTLVHRKNSARDPDMGAFVREVLRAYKVRYPDKYLKAKSDIEGFFLELKWPKYLIDGL